MKAYKIFKNQTGDRFIKFENGTSIPADIAKLCVGADKWLSEIKAKCRDCGELSPLRECIEAWADTEEANALIQSYDSSDYDTEAMAIDQRNGNFSPEKAEDYRHENIVRASLMNGQFTQAKTQCRSYGLNYDEQLRLHSTPEASR